MKKKKKITPQMKGFIYKATSILIKNFFLIIIVWKLKTLLLMLVKLSLCLEEKYSLHRSYLL